jgi:vacuolar-type H+-ATPase catalytic subunit A/Vma1
MYAKITEARTKEELFKAIQEDEGYQAWKAAHPERAEARKNMTKEEKKELLINLITELGEQERERKEQQQYKEMKELLDRQFIIQGDTWDAIKNYCTREKQDPLYNEMLLLLDMFQYGRICGIRQERARRKGEQA